MSIGPEINNTMEFRFYLVPGLLCAQEFATYGAQDDLWRLKNKLPTHTGCVDDDILSLG